MPRNSSKFTTDHDEIRKWVEERGGSPAEVKRTSGAGQTGILRIDFPGYSGERSLQKIEWDDFFRKFDASNLAFVYQEQTARGEKSNFNKIVGRETVEARQRGVRTSRRTGRRQAQPAAAARTTRSATGTRKRAPARGRATAAAKKPAGRTSSSSRTSAGSRGGSRSRTTRKRSR